MSDIKKVLQIDAPVEKVWAALTDPAAIKGWIGSDSVVEIDLTVGGSYRLFGGETTGTFTVIAPPNTLEYTWRQGEWDDNWKDSVVKWYLHAEGGGTHVHLKHEQFPNDHERDSHDEGWDSYWLGPMKAWLESR